MKRFIKKGIYFSAAFILFYLLIAQLFVSNNPHFANKLFNQSWLNTLMRIHDAESGNLSDTLFVGCSVADQMIPYDGNKSLVTNGSTLPIGNYFLIKKALENNPNITTVIYLTVPSVLGHPLARAHTYPYFVKPFYSNETEDFLSQYPGIMNILHRNPSLRWNKYNWFKLMAMDDFDYEPKREGSLDSLYTASIHWVGNIKDLCEAQKVTFHLAAPPVAVSEKNSDRWQVIKKLTKSTSLEPLFDKYFSTMQYLDDSLRRDHIHWKDKYMDQHRRKLRWQTLKPLKR